MSPIDVALVAAYFGLMVVLSVYGLHRYHLIYLYYRHRGRVQGLPTQRFGDLPAVTVQLPVYNERFVVEQLIESACRLDYPTDLLEIQVLDDSTDDTSDVARATVARLQSDGHRVEYRHRSNREGYKAGALEAGLTSADGELIAVFDADFSPAPDFLRRTIHYFADPQVGMVQARWGYRNREESLLTRLQAMLLDGHFVFEHGARARSGRFFNFNGTAGVLRKSMIADAGGWQHDTLTEDTELSYRAQLRGWKFLYLPHIEVESELPEDMASFQVQQARWAKGLIQTAIKLLPRILRSDQPLRVKIEAFFHLTANISYPLMLLLSVLVLPSMVVRFYHWDGRLLWLDLPVFLATFSSLSSFYVLAQRELKHGSALGNLAMLPMLVATGIGLTISNTRAVLEAILGIRSGFRRTAKYSAKSDSGQGRATARRQYGVRGGWRAAANLAGAAYFAMSLWFTVTIRNWPTMPFLSLFLLGYAFAGGLMLIQSPGREERSAS